MEIYCYKKKVALYMVFHISQNNAKQNEYQEQ